MSTYTPIAYTTLTSAASSVIFGNIPQTYTDIVMVFNGVADNNLSLIFNSDYSSTYSVTRIGGYGSSAQSGRFSSIGAMYGPYAAGQQVTLWQVMNYSNSTTYKTGLARGGDVTQIEAYVGLWRNTAAITSLTVLSLSGNMASGSTINLYGIDAQASAQAKATGGHTIIRDSNYWYHVFNSSGTFTPTEAITVDYLVVAGGGGGGGGLGGGGGGGGMLCTVTATGGGGSLQSTLSLNQSTDYAVTVGAGGSGGSANQGSAGSNSVFSTVTATGGGGGSSGSVSSYTTGSGGSGGGGGNGFSAGTRTASPVQGNNGGAGTAAGGGGGAGATGGNSPNGSQGGNGGNGQATSITGSSVTYAGGGGGSQDRYNSATQGSGGTGGGGAGATGQTGSGVNGTAGTVNLGGGGGGGGNNSSNGAAGGSGIVIIRYAV